MQKVGGMELQYSLDKNLLRILLNGDYLGFDDNQSREDLLSQIRNGNAARIVIDAAGLRKWDSSLPALIFDLSTAADGRQIKLEYQNFPDSLSKLTELARLVDRKPDRRQEEKLPWLETVGSFGIAVAQAVAAGLSFMHRTFLSIGRFFAGSAVMRRVDFLFALEDCSYKAVGIVSLVSFMVGLILAFVGAIQLKNFGAQIYVASLVAIGMTRIMGAIMVGIIMAGRTGASYAATIGTMQVNEEIDALKTMGISTQDFLVLPRILALTFTIPLLTILADFMGILGGAAVGVGMLGISASEYWTYSLDALDMTNFTVGLFHGLVFGVIISLCGCYYGVNCGRNADSVGKATTQAVVSAIVWMIVATGIITLIFEVLGI